MRGRDARSEQRGTPDLRAVALAAAAWTGGLAGFLLPSWVTACVLGAAGLVLAWAWRRGRRLLTGAACLLAAAAVAVAAGVRAEANRSGPVPELAAVGAYVELHAKVTSDPVLREGRFAPYVMTRLTVTRVTGRGRTYRTHAPVLVLADPSWRRVRLGSTVSAAGRLARPDSSDLSAVLSTSRPPAQLTPPAATYDAAARVRAAIRAAVAPAGPEERALIPALVVGDDQQMSAQVVADFRTCGLTHLTAVSGTNLTLVVGFLLIVARALGVRARGLTVVGLLGVAGFVVLARPEPSVIRAAAMGSVALLGMGRLGRERGVRGLGVAVFALMLFDPWLATSIGFVLSALATAGIVFLAPPFRDALTSWLPRWLAEALAVPFAAQLVCTPVVAAISGQVSLVAVAANLAVAWAVGPATVLGLLGGLAMLVLPPLGHLCGWLAGWSAWWIVTVATHLARLPGAAVGWTATPVSIGVLTVLCLGVAVLAGRILRRRTLSVCTCVLLLVVLVRPLPTPGWPPDGWVLIACDVGQGDGLVLNAGSGRAVVVDTGPDPVLMGRCLRGIGVRRLPVVVLTHYHADHVDGLPAVLSGRQVGEIDVTATRDPPENAAAVDAWAAAAEVPVRVAPYGEVRRVGDLTWQVVGPVRPVLTDETGEEGSIPNNASLVLLVRVRGVSILMSGDMEPPAQRLLHRSLPDLHVDVLKVPHHGSRYQDPQLITTLGARLAVISVGADNDYGHPAASTLAMLRSAGMQVRRTDRDGTIAVVVRHGRLGVATHG
ncbi:MAG TPA: ComEC/Rec2 family competence protein [Nocardioidaceae bacterium]|nr:ComEC/Rec2 family competence protein [Nocardioidaceae bacterium]